MTPLETFHQLAKPLYETFHCEGPEKSGIKRFPDQEKLKEVWLKEHPEYDFYAVWDEYVESKLYRDFVNDYKRR